jgi:hypothetical protein
VRKRIFGINCKNDSLLKRQIDFYSL